MDKGIRERINLLKEKQGFKDDKEIIAGIYKFKKNRGEIKKVPEYVYIDNNKGSFSQCFNGNRKFKPEDYLAIEYVLDTSMAYIIEGKGELSKSFHNYGIRYAAFVDTVGNYELLMNDGVVNGSDEYNKSLIDYMMEYESKNGFIFFAKKEMLPLTSTGGPNFSPDCLHTYPLENTELLKILCKVLPIELLAKYFHGFLEHNNIMFSIIDDKSNTSFTDDVMEEAINREDLRKELTCTRIMDLNAFNERYVRFDGKPLGNGLFVNYGLTVMTKYVLTHDVGEDIRNEVLNSAIMINEESFKSAASFKEEELRIDQYGYITDKHGYVFYGSIVVPTEPSVNLSNASKDLYERLLDQTHNFHRYMSKHSVMSIFDNEIYIDKKDNDTYYNFFKLMNQNSVKTIPVFSEEESKDKDVFKVSNSKESTLANAVDVTLSKIIEQIRIIDDISIKALGGKTYFLVRPSIYMFEMEVNYIIPKDVVVSSRYANLVRFLNENVVWGSYDPRPQQTVKQMVSLLKLYGLKKEDLDDFIQEFLDLAEQQIDYLDKTTEQGKLIAYETLRNKGWLNIYRDAVIKAY